MTGEKKNRYVFLQAVLDIGRNLLKKTESLEWKAYYDNLVRWLCFLTIELISLLSSYLPDYSLFVMLFLPVSVDGQKYHWVNLIVEVPHNCNKRKYRILSIFKLERNINKWANYYYVDCIEVTKLKKTKNKNI